MRQVFFSAMIVALLAAPGALAQTAPAAPADPHAMSRRDLEAEVRAQRPYLRYSGVVAANRPVGCREPESRQFDFWLGEWEVSPTGASMILAESSITLADQGCVVLEEWRPFSGASAHSISAYDAASGRWRQAYAGSGGGWTLYSGRVDGGVLRFDNESSADGQRQRMNYQRLDADSVRQWGETFDAARGAWTVTWDFTYRRRPGSLPPSTQE